MQHIVMAVCVKFMRTRKYAFERGCYCMYNVLLYSQTKGVKQKYILCISGLVAYRQYIHNCSIPADPYWLTAVSQLSAPPLSWACLCSPGLVSAAALRC